jgi:preprotein translocase subunit YajC
LDFNWPILMGAPQDGSGGGGMYFFLWIGLIMVFMYLLLIHPQRKKQKEHQKLISELKKGDRVVTTGGMFGTIFAIDDKNNRIVLKINENTRLEFLKSSIAARVDE